MHLCSARYNIAYNKWCIGGEKLMQISSIDHYSYNATMYISSQIFCPLGSLLLAQSHFASIMPVFYLLPLYNHVPIIPIILPAKLMDSY